MCNHDVPRRSSDPRASLVLAPNGHFFYAQWGFNDFYEMGLSTDGTKVQAFKTHSTDGPYRRMTSTTVGDINYLFTSEDDNTVHVYKSDGSAYKVILKFDCSGANHLMWLKERSILLVSQWNTALGGESVRAFKFSKDFKKKVNEAIVCDAKEGLNIYSWTQAGVNGVTLFDGKKNELVDLKII